MSNQSELQAKLETCQKQLREAEERQNALSEFMSYELRTALSVIIGYSELLSKSSLSDTQIEMIQGILEAASNLIEATDGILESNDTSRL